MGFLWRGTKLTIDPLQADHPPSSSTTKWDIDQTLTGKARANAKKNAAKKAKNAKEAKDGVEQQTKGEDDNEEEGAGGASTMV